jgi:vacuolar iron transporter family protein
MAGALSVLERMAAKMKKKSEHHYLHRSGWMRAAVLGANDGIVSTASLITGMSAAGTDRTTVILAGIAGLVAGAMSMAAGEYVSVSSQADTERADLQRETKELVHRPEDEMHELAQIYRERGVEPRIAKIVAQQLMDHNALAAHARDELGLTEVLAARPFQAAFISAISFTIGAFLPLIITLAVSAQLTIVSVVNGSLLILGTLGAVAAKLGGASIIRGGFRVMIWGAVAMAVTAAIGRILNVII